MQARQTSHMPASVGDLAAHTAHRPQHSGKRALEYMMESADYYNDEHRRVKPRLTVCAATTRLPMSHMQKCTGRQAQVDAYPVAASWQVN